MNPGKITTFSSATKLSLLAIVILVGAVFFTVNSAMQQETGAGHAWYTTESAKAVCTNLGTTIDVSFTNTETSNNYAMNVVAQDVTTGQSVTLGTVNAQATKTGIIQTTRSGLPNGGVVFKLTWSNGMVGTDERTAAYTGITCQQIQPTPTCSPPPTCLRSGALVCAMPITGWCGYPTPVPTAIPTEVPQPTDKPEPNDTVLSFTIGLHGIGSGGDSANSNSQGNTSPLHPSRTIHVDIYDVQNQLTTSEPGTITYDPNSGKFTGSVDLGSQFVTGLYTIKVKTDQYLRAIIPGIQTITAGKTQSLPRVTLVAGDINGDNAINIEDYNILIGCYSDLLPATDCNASNNVLADLTDDGHVNQFDYNLFLRELTNIGGE